MRTDKERVNVLENQDGLEDLEEADIEREREIANARQDAPGQDEKTICTPFVMLSFLFLSL